MRATWRVIDRMVGFDIGRFRYPLKGIGSILATALFAGLVAHPWRIAPKLTTGGWAGGWADGRSRPITDSGWRSEATGKRPSLPLGLLLIFWALMTLQERGWADDPAGRGRRGCLFGLGRVAKSRSSCWRAWRDFLPRRSMVRSRTPRIFRAGAIIVVVACTLTVAPLGLPELPLLVSAFVPIRDNLGIELGGRQQSLHSDGTTFGGGTGRSPSRRVSEELARLRELGEDSL